MRIGRILLIFFAVVGFSGIAEAGLVVIGTATYSGRDYNLIYEDDQGLIWLDYSNSISGNWIDLKKWAADLNAAGVLTYKLNSGVKVSWNGDWRLPKTVDGKRTWGYEGTTTAGCNIETSEMGHLYYKSLGNLGYHDISGKLRTGWGDAAAWGLKNKGPFTKLYPESYWSGTEYSMYTEHAWAFNFAFGTQSNMAFKHLGAYSAVAVRSGKVFKSSAQ